METFTSCQLLACDVCGHATTAFQVCSMCDHHVCLACASNRRTLGLPYSHPCEYLAWMKDRSLEHHEGVFRVA